MKKILFIISMLLSFPIMAFAHTTVSSSTPSKGEVITEDIRELNVQFEGNIENHSTLTLRKEQEKITIDSITINNKQITGTLPTPLENGNYILTWKIASTDGHVLTGDIPFTVNILEGENKKIVQEETTQEVETKKNSEAPIDENTESAVEPETVKDNNSLISTISVIVLVILLGFGIWILLRKKR